MIAAWMLYCMGIGLAFVVVGHALERALHLAGRPTRWAWVLALAGSFLLPAAAWVVPGAFRAVPVPAPEPVAYQPVVDPGPTASFVAVAPGAAPRTLAPTDLDGPLAWGWALGTAAVLTLLGIAALRLAILQRRWRAIVVDGRRVLLSEHVGPAVAGVWAPQIVIPGWALSLTEAQRELMLAHEEQHVRAGDPRLLAFGALAVLLTPWNPALWWQLRRLRLAVEIDCDARVLAGGGPAPEYGDLLVQVGGRRSGLALAAALGEPRSFLEHRIRRMATALPRWRWLGAAAAIVVAAGAVVGACEAPRPVETDALQTLQARIDSAMPTLQARIDSAMAEWMRPWVLENLRRFYPDLLRETSGPPVDVWFGHDARLQVSHVGKTVSKGGAIGSDQIRAIFPLFRPGADAWGVVDRRVLDGLVRSNVRVIWFHLSTTDTHALRATPTQPVADAASRQAAVLARQYFPELLRGREEPVYLWLLFDSQGRLVAKGTARRPLSDRSMSTDFGPRLIPGYDTLLNGAVKEYGILGYGVLAPNSPPVMWARVGARRASAPVPTRRAPGQGADEVPQLVDERVRVVPGATLRYPELLRRAGIEGRVTVRALVEASGRVEPASVRVIDSPHPGFNQAVMDYVRTARFDPVRGWVDVPVEFKIGG